MGCQRRFNTYEQVEERRLWVVKKDGRREAYDRQKVLTGLQLACRKRPVPAEVMERISDEIEAKLYDRGTSEVQSREIGLTLSDSLRAIDQVAYVRFASIYFDFQDVSEFARLLERLGVTVKRSPRSRSAAKDADPVGV